jgi:hypothetical protein
MIRAMFFDAGNTLIHMDYRAIAAALAAQGINVGAAEVSGRVASPVHSTRPSAARPTAEP